MGFGRGTGWADDETTLLVGADDLATDDALAAEDLPTDEAALLTTAFDDGGETDEEDAGNAAELEESELLLCISPGSHAKWSGFNSGT